MIRIIFYLILGYLLYKYILKPIFDPDEKPSSKDDDHTSSHKNVQEDKNTEGEYIDYEELNE